MAIYLSVEWKFIEIFYNLLEKWEVEGKNVIVLFIVFRDVYLFYVQVDIVSFFDWWNYVIQVDFLENLYLLLDFFDVVIGMGCYFLFN